AAIDSESRPDVWSFPVRDAEAEATMVAHVIPIRLSARDIFVRCFAVLVLTPMTRPQAPSVELVQSLFDLTPAEARVARSLASGRTPKDIAIEGGASPETVHTQLGRVLAKTGCVSSMPRRRATASSEGVRSAEPFGHTTSTSSGPAPYRVNSTAAAASSDGSTA